MKGCAIFLGIFVVGVGLLVGGLVYDTLVGQNLENGGGPARVVELIGVIMMFGTAFGLAGWGFYRRVQDQKRAQLLKLAESKPHKPV